jgi:hypothetical protein
LYVPGFRLSDTLFEPPENVGVAPTTAPVEDATVKLCGSEEAFVNATETLPALAVSEFVSNFNWPSALAAMLSAELPVAGAGVEAAAELEVVGAGAALVVAAVEELVVLDELPQPANASRPAARASAETLGTNCVVARAAA